jgi:hypothetical protein
MCLALFIAWGSAAGQPKVVALLPKALNQPLPSFLPALIVLALMVFWLIRIRIPNRRRRPAATSIPAQEALT